MTDAPTQWLPILVASSVVTDWERTFCASLIRQTRTRGNLSPKQAATLTRIVEAHRPALMGEDDELTEPCRDAE